MVARNVGWIGYAADLGASTGRTFLGFYDGQRLTLKEVTRFRNESVLLGGTTYWDFPFLFRETANGIKKAIADGYAPVSVGVDTWGVDFGLIDKNGELVSNPLHYRNKFFSEMVADVLGVISAVDLFKKTGVQLLQINTIFQLMYLLKSRPHLLEASRHVVLLPDLINFFLTGELGSEVTHASTTQLFNPTNGRWECSIMDRLGLPKRLFPPIVKPFTRLGQVSAHVLETSPASRISVVNVGEHDTASAVFATPCNKGGCAYISSGTWSLVGVVTPRPVLSDMARRYNFTNEAAVGGGVRLLKNVMGLWLLHEVSKQFEKQGMPRDYNRLLQMATSAEPFLALIDPDCPEFLAPDNMVATIQHYCTRTEQSVPAEPGHIVRTILESLALKYRWAIACLEELQEQRLSVIHVVGGGCKNELLCQWTADATNRVVIAGPVEATVTGNLTAQLISAGELGGVNEISDLLSESIQRKVYYPVDQRASWDQAYETFRKLLHLSSASEVSGFAAE